MNSIGVEAVACERRRGPTFLVGWVSSGVRSALLRGTVPLFLVVLCAFALAACSSTASASLNIVEGKLVSGACEAASLVSIADPYRAAERQLTFSASDSSTTTLAFLHLALRPAPGTAATMRLPGGTFFIPLELSPTDKALALRIGNGARGDGFIAARFDPSVEANGFNTLMTEAPASGYQSELVIPPGDYFRDPEKKLYFFIKSGSYFGKGSLSRISYQNIPGKCEVLRAEVRIHFATDQQRKLITRGL